MKLSIIFLTASSLFATTVTSVTCSGSTVTVNSTSHGLSAVQGFILTGTNPQFDGSVATSATNSFTFKLPSWATCSSFTTGYSAVVAAQQIFQLPGVAIPATGQVNQQMLYEFTTLYPNPLACNQASAAATMTVASSVGTITTGTTTSYSASQAISLSGSATAAVNGGYSVASVVWPNQLTITTIGVSDGAYAGLVISSGTVCPKSAYSGASAALNAAIVAGTTLETYGAQLFAANTSGSTIQSFFISQYQTMQAGFTGGLLATGYCFNGTGGTFTTNCVN